MRFATDHCITPFADGQEFRDFSEGWGNINESNKFARMNWIWKYQTHQIAGTSDYDGEFATYPGGGYIATLGRTWKNSLTNMNYFHRNDWIDRYTRCLFLEFLMYSPNSNLFQSVRVAFELAYTGLVLAMYNVQTAHLLFVQNESSVVFQVVIALVALMVCILLVKLLLKMAKKKKLFLKDLWILADIIIISLSLACLFLFLERSLVVKMFLDKIGNAKHNEFINYFNLFSSVSTLTILAAVLVFIATLRLWKLLRFLLIIKIFEKILGLSVARLLLLFLYQTLLIFLFQLIGRILFGDQHEFRHSGDSMMTLILLALCFPKTYDFHTVKTLLQRFYFSLYLLASFFFLTFYIAVITNCYADAQIYYSNQRGYNMYDYLNEQYLYFKEVVAKKTKTLRIRGGQDISSAEENPIFPKAYTRRYAKCLKIPENRINIMGHITRGIVWNMKSKKKQKNKLIQMIIANMMRDDRNESDYFFVGSSGSEKTIFVDDLIFKKMERIVNVLLSRREQIYRKVLENNEKTFGEIEGKLSNVSYLLGEVDFTFDH
ncbi:hypothetical protein JTB14_025901 [Gonioctena quinquepunctata]|nr:hypothetical protein JTB14_025901 [Gonioctena quinquepunctata]